MLAFEPNIPIAYSVPMTVGSVIVAVFGALLALLVWLFCPFRAVGIVAGGALLGASVTAMHYCGVMAMHVPGTLHFDRGGVVASVMVSVAFAILALARSETLTSYRRRLEVTGWLTFAICGMHFTAMAALSIELGRPGSYDGVLLGSGPLAVAVGSVSLAILIVSLAATLMEQHLSQRAVLELKRMQLLSDISQEILIIHRDGTILQINAAGDRMFWAEHGQLIGSQVLDLVREADRPTVLWREQHADVDLNHEEILVHTTTGTLIPVEFSCTGIDYEARPAIMIALRNVSERKRDEAKIRHLAHHDALTDLPNRFLLRERLAQAQDATVRSKDILALLYLDLDHFKPVNDLLGHAAGDTLLIQVSKRLLAELRPTDTLARVGGDEFVIVATFDQLENVATLARRLAEKLARPFDLDGHQVRIGASIGIAVYPEDGEHQQALMRAADIALYRSKQEGRGSFRFFEPIMDEHLQVRQKLQQDMQWALERNQLVLHYQPLVSCVTGEVEGFEALVRWNHPERGLVPPLEFIPLAEETGLIVKIGQWVLESACATAAEWKEPRSIAVNVSPVQFRQTDLAGTISGILNRTGLPPSRLEIEITEGVLMEDPNRAAEVLSALRTLGVRIALDDFGTGYSSLSYLHTFKFDKIKIDKSFVDRLGEGGTSRRAGASRRRVAAIAATSGATGPTSIAGRRNRRAR
jgi:diguanylate cyclase